MTESVESLYQQYIKSLPHSEQLRLVERIAAGVAQQEEVAQELR